ncbi:MAG: hypothetical protein QE263_03725 [Vampirovibrionales bacterium]|nr:hypothetical protein [Vampirovibrionales bacterium]
MSFNGTEMPASPYSANDSLAFQYHGVHAHNHCRTQGLILAGSEQEARLSLRAQSIVALKLSLVSAANPLVTAQSTSAHQRYSFWHWLAPWTKAKQSIWREQTLSLLATALDQAPLLQALAIVERQLTALNAPAVWPAALLVWRDGLAKGSTCYEALQPFANVWGSDWLAWIEACELQGMPLAPLTPWINVKQHRHLLHVGLQPTVWRCSGWAIALTGMIALCVLKNPHHAMALIVNGLGIALPILLVGSWVFYELKKRLDTLLTLLPDNTLHSGWAAWWMALHLQARDADNLSPLEALQLAVQIPSAHKADFLPQVLAAAEAGQPLEVALSQSPYLPVADRLQFEAVQDSIGLRQAIETCWHHAETENANRGLRWLIGLEIGLTLLTLMSLSVWVN